MIKLGGEEYLKEKNGGIFGSKENFCHNSPIFIPLNFGIKRGGGGGDYFFYLGLTHLKGGALPTQLKRFFFSLSSCF